MMTKSPIPQKSGRNHQNGFVLMGSVVLLFFISVLLAAAFLRTNIELTSSERRISTQQAFYGAEAGMDRAIFQLRRNINWRPTAADVNVPVDRIAGDDTTVLAYYTIQASANTQVFQGLDTLWVRSTGQNARRNVAGVPPTPRAVEARVWVQNPAAFLFSTLGNLKIYSGSTIQDDILGRNIDFYVNNNLPPAQRSITMTGKVNYLSSVTRYNNSYVNGGGGVSRQLIPAMTFSGIDLDYYRLIAQGANGRYYSSGNQTLDLSSVDSTIDIVLVEGGGNLTVSGTYDHSIIVIADGNITITNNIMPDASLAETPQIGLMANRDVIIAGSAPNNLNVEAFLLANGNGTSNGRFRALGTRGTKGTLNFHGSIAVRGESSATAIDTNVYNTRNYSFNDQLRDNRSIPYLLYIANIVPGTWREVDDPNNAPFPPS